MNIAVLPGSFDPITKGHEDIVRRALPLFDKLIVAVGINSVKKYLFPLEQRLAFLEATFADEPKVEIDTYQKLTADYCAEKGARFILRGTRNSTDYNYENTIAHLNRDLGDGLETIFLMSAPEYSFYSSTIVREIIKGGGNADKYVPDAIVTML
ncbi:MAG: pantetheine-phosphate adenylyltransferase [Aureispira sp.]|nr:pantetheine-phosphate adenylyltransferase [Aureispira sp.]